MEVLNKMNESFSRLGKRGILDIVFCIVSIFAWFRWALVAPIFPNEPTANIILTSLCFGIGVAHGCRFFYIRMMERLLKQESERNARVLNQLKSTVRQMNDYGTSQKLEDRHYDVGA